MLDANHHTERHPVMPKRTVTQVRLFEVEKLGIATEGGHVIGYRVLDD